MALDNGSSADEWGLQAFRIERGARAEASDGPLGSVEQIVVDRDTGELRALVIRAADGGPEFELPASTIQHATGDQVFLAVSLREIAHTPHLTQPYDPAQYMPVYVGPMKPRGTATRIARDTDHPVVTDIEADAVQVVAPGGPTGTETDARTGAPPDPVAPASGRSHGSVATNAPAKAAADEHTDHGAFTTPLDAAASTRAGVERDVPRQQMNGESRQLYRTGDIYPPDQPLAGPGQHVPPLATAQLHKGPFRRRSFFDASAARPAPNGPARAAIAVGLAAGIAAGVLLGLRRRRARARKAV